MGVSTVNQINNLINSSYLKDWGGKALLILFIIIIARIGLSVINALIERTLKDDGGRTRTLKGILKSVTRYGIYFIVIITVLDELNIPIAAVLSAAGIVGLAVGFGAQSLVRDVIAGFFIILEDQFSVGDYIETEGVGGVVEDVGLRITKLRDWDGRLHIIPNGKITIITNHNRGSMRAMVEVGVDYEEDINRTLKVIQEVADEVAKDYDSIINEGPTVLGISKIGDAGIVIRTVAKTKPHEQWKVEMELRRRIKEAFDREGIRVSPPAFVYPKIQA